MSSYLGQNFLTDQTILHTIAQEVENLYDAQNCDTLIEIGPGQGALTKHIQDISKQTLLIEYDEQMINYLKNHNILADHTTLINKDILQRDYTNLDDATFQISSEQTLIVGNLPYYITSPIIRKFFETQTPTRAGGVFLVQKEVAERLVDSASKKSFLWRLINFSHRVEYCFDVPATAFEPAPKVTSAVIRIIPKSVSDIPSLDYDKLLTFLDLYSPYKRKTLGKITKMLAKKDHNKHYNTTDYSGKRLEELSWEELETIVK